MNTAMPMSNSASAEELGRLRAMAGTNPNQLGLHASAVSWGAILAGAAAAAALSLILVILGVGLGLSAVSPWSQKGMGAAGFGVSTILWLTLTQLAASGLGGYLAGRLRNRWLAVQEDEVYFRDTAHGFLTWAIASLATAALLTSVTESMVSTGVQAGATAVGSVSAMGATAGAAAINSELSKPDADGSRTSYFMDSLFRPNTGTDPNAAATAAPQPGNGSAAPGNGEQLAEVTRIFMNTLRTGPLPPEDVHYAGQLVAQRTGLSQPEAEKRVTDTYSRMQARFNATQAAAREAADQARKASAYSALWFVVALLAGAFVASFAAIFGGRQRDL